MSLAYPFGIIRIFYRVESRKLRLFFMEKEALVRGILEAIGEDPDREGLRGTPGRVVRSWGDLFSGYGIDESDVLTTTFLEGACREQVIESGIQFYSTCEHHMLPFFGTVSIGYLPRDRVVGASKLARLVDMYARRLQIQERLTTQVAEAIVRCLDPAGVMVVVRAQHMCMTSRGVRLQDVKFTTSAIRGLYSESSALRNEFLMLERA